MNIYVAKLKLNLKLLSFFDKYTLLIGTERYTDKPVLNSHELKEPMGPALKTLQLAELLLKGKIYILELQQIQHPLGVHCS